uniref:Solute carrier organic anion transporter family member n=1 Tax=Clytia hemisphaerica TaxID=252671 RepID=A0A7M5XGD7_9CNID
MTKNLLMKMAKEKKDEGKRTSNNSVKNDKSDEEFMTLHQVEETLDENHRSNIMMAYTDGQEAPQNKRKMNIVVHATDSGKFGQNYTALLVNEHEPSDFYITDPRLPPPKSPIRFEFDRHSSYRTKRMENPAYRKDSPDVDERNIQVKETVLPPSHHKKSVVSSENGSSASFNNPHYRYGWSKLTPKLLQFMNKPVWFLVFLCVAGVAQGLVVTGVAFTILTSIEKQFGFSSSHVALFGTVYDTAYGIFCVFIGYVGHRHKPRFLGYGLIIMACGAVLTSVPKYIIGTYDVGTERDTDFCRFSVTSTHTPICGGSAEWYYTLIFLAGNAMIGIGATPLYVLGPSHLDEITHRGQNALYTGIFYACAALGPALGFIIGLPILNTWVDLEQPANSNLTPEDRNWVGAWWIGYLVGAVIMLLPAAPMLGFPKLFPNAEKVKQAKSELEDTIEEDKNLNHNFKSVWPATKSLLKNIPFVCICLASATESLAIGGFSTFFSKFVETQFHVTSGSSSLYSGVIIIPGAAGGMFLGGFLINRYKWNCKQILRAASMMAFVAAVCVASTLIGCKGREVVGGDLPYANSSTISLQSGCNEYCQCSIRYYKPVCSVVDQQTYFSPCHAGCSNNHTVTIDGEKHFQNCSCVASLVKDGRCTPECNLFPLFFVCAFLMMFFTFMNNVPMLMATLRVVPEGQGSFAMGFQQIFVRFLGFIPAPTLFGSLIDKSCKLWHEDECTDSKTSCLEYENEDFRYYLFILGAVTKVLTFIFLFAAYKTYTLPPNKRDDSVRHPRTNQITVTER